MNRLVAGVLASALLLVGTAPAHAQAPETETAPGSPETAVRTVYDLVSWNAGEMAEWDAVRAVFVPEAVIILRYPQGLTSFSVETFVQDFIDFAGRADVESSGFRETVVAARVWEFGDIAHVVTVYEASIPGRDRPPTRGVDSWSLTRVEDTWKVVSVVNELPGPGRDIPEALFD
jgi:hypothetical protein